MRYHPTVVGYVTELIALCSIVWEAEWTSHKNSANNVPTMSCVRVFIQDTHTRVCVCVCVRVYVC